MRTALSLRKHRGSCRLYCHYFHVRILGFQIFTNTSDRSACTNTCHKNIYLSVCVSPDFRTCGLFVDRRICRVIKLSRNKTVLIFLRKFVCFGDCAIHTFCSICQYDFCTVCFQNIPSLNTHCLRHRKYHSVSFDCSKRSKTDSGVT